MFLKNSGGKPSATFTVFVLSCAIGMFKLVMSGIEINGFKFETFDGLSFGAVLGAAGAIYALRRNKEDEGDK